MFFEHLCEFPENLRMLVRKLECDLQDKGINICYKTVLEGELSINYLLEKDGFTTSFTINFSKPVNVQKILDSINQRIEHFRRIRVK